MSGMAAQIPMPNVTAIPKRDKRCRRLNRPAASVDSANFLPKDDPDVESVSVDADMTSFVFVEATDEPVVVNVSASWGFV